MSDVVLSIGVFYWIMLLLYVIYNACTDKNSYEGDNNVASVGIVVLSTCVKYIQDSTTSILLLLFGCSFSPVAAAGNSSAGVI